MTGWERVYWIDEFNDIPRGGTADCDGKPHIFRCRFDKAQDDWSEEYQLFEIDAATLELFKLKQIIWHRWRESFNTGKTDIKTHPALPEDRADFENLGRRIANALEKLPRETKIASATFRSIDIAKGEAEVRWSPRHDNFGENT
jgi:hypothetical protein